MIAYNDTHTYIRVSARALSLSFSLSLSLCLSLIHTYAEACREVVGSGVERFELIHLLTIYCTYFIYFYFIFILFLFYFYFRVRGGVQRGSGQWSGTL